MKCKRKNEKKEETGEVKAKVIGHYLLEQADIHSDVKKEKTCFYIEPGMRAYECYCTMYYLYYFSVQHELTYQFLCIEPALPGEPTPLKLCSVVQG